MIYTYLSEQRTDVEKGQGGADGVIDEITRQMTEIFAQQFQLLNESFQETFLELFGGGKARLELEDENGYFPPQTDPEDMELEEGAFVRNIMTRIKFLPDSD